MMVWSLVSLSKIRIVAPLPVVKHTNGEWIVSQAFQEESLIPGAEPDARQFFEAKIAAKIAHQATTDGTGGFWLSGNDPGSQGYTNINETFNLSPVNGPAYVCWGPMMKGRNDLQIHITPVPFWNQKPGDYSFTADLVVAPTV